MSFYKKQNSEGGYIMLLMLLFGVVLMIFMIVRTDLLPGVESKKSMIEQNTEAINKAKDVRSLIEENSRQAVE